MKNTVPPKPKVKNFKMSLGFRKKLFPNHEILEKIHRRDVYYS